MNSLKRQVAKARRYQALAADVRVLDTHLGHKRFVELSAQAGELRTAIGARERREAELGGRIPGGARGGRGAARGAGAGGGAGRGARATQRAARQAGGGRGADGV